MSDLYIHVSIFRLQNSFLSFLEQKCPMTREAVVWWGRRVVGKVWWAAQAHHSLGK